MSTIRRDFKTFDYGHVAGASLMWEHKGLVRRDVARYLVMTPGKAQRMIDSPAWQRDMIRYIVEGIRYRYSWRGRLAHAWRSLWNS